MQKYIAQLLAILFGGEKAVARALSAFDKVTSNLEVAIEKLSAEKFESVAVADKAWDYYKKIEDREWDKQQAISKAQERAHNVLDRVKALTA